MSEFLVIEKFTILVIIVFTNESKRCFLVHALLVKHCALDSFILAHSKLAIWQKHKNFKKWIDYLLIFIMKFAFRHTKFAGISGNPGKFYMMKCKISWLRFANNQL